MNKFKSLMMFAILMVSAVLTSCNDDDDYKTSTETLATSSQLMSILKNDGYSFDDKGHLILDDKALNTTTLDLSNTKIDTAELKSLSILPNLKEVSLANNGYGDKFNFALLPSQITGIDLTGNDIYFYDNLVKVDVAENGDETVTPLRNITKLYLPEAAKYNIAQLMRFYRQNKTAIDNGTMDVKMADSNGKLSKYNTKRWISDENLRNELKSNFSDLFDGDTLDISNHITNVTQRVSGIDFEEEDIKDYNGIFYIINNPYWEGTSIVIMPTENIELLPVYLPARITMFGLTNATVDKIKLEKNNQLSFFALLSVNNIKSVDLSQSATFGQRGKSEIDDAAATVIMVCDCPSLEEIKIPENKKFDAHMIDLENLPKLKYFSLKNFKGVGDIVLGDIAKGGKIEFPDELTDFGYYKLTGFAITNQTYNDNKEATEAFVRKNRNNKAGSLMGSMFNGSNEGSGEFDVSNIK